MPGASPTPNAQALELPPGAVNFRRAIVDLCVIKESMTDAAKLEVLNTICQTALYTVLFGEPAVKASLRGDYVFTQTCWRVSHSISDYSKIDPIQSKALYKTLRRLDKSREGCFYGYGEFMSALGQRFTPKWKEGVNDSENVEWATTTKQVIVDESAFVPHRRSDHEEDEYTCK
jgi:hypothetical protein